MSRLEGVAKRVLTPFILSESGAIEPEDQGTVAAWVQKTALVAVTRPSKRSALEIARRRGDDGCPTLTRVS
jgi:hypothetical protein